MDGFCVFQKSKRGVYSLCVMSMLIVGFSRLKNHKVINTIVHINV